MGMPQSLNKCVVNSSFRFQTKAMVLTLEESIARKRKSEGSEKSFKTRT
jgi:hypothetical protein